MQTHAKPKDPHRKFRAAPPPPAMHHADIKAALIKKGYSQTRVGHELGVNAQTVHNIIIGKNTSRRIATYIAQLIEIPIDQIWPDRYN